MEIVTNFSSLMQCSETSYSTGNIGLAFICLELIESKKVVLKTK